MTEFDPWKIVDVARELVDSGQPHLARRLLDAVELRTPSRMAEWTVADERDRQWRKNLKKLVDLVHETVEEDERKKSTN